jgi:hypothetical protein
MKHRSVTRGAQGPMHTTPPPHELPTGAAAAGAPPPGGDDIGRFISELLYTGPLYRKLYSLRRAHPELAHELDEIARAVRQVTGEIEAYVRTRSTG